MLNLVSPLRFDFHAFVEYSPSFITRFANSVKLVARRENQKRQTFRDRWSTSYKKCIVVRWTERSLSLLLASVSTVANSSYTYYEIRYVVGKTHRGMCRCSRRRRPVQETKERNVEVDGRPGSPSPQRMRRGTRVSCRRAPRAPLSGSCLLRLITKS
jgi:hypothetical protein